MDYESDPSRFLNSEEIADIEKYSSILKRSDDSKPFVSRIIMSDIHGCYHILVKMLRYISKHHDARIFPAQLIFLGDYIDRGKHSCKVIATIRLLQDILGEGCVALTGNHEDMLLASWREGYAYNYPETEASFPYQTVPADVRLWIMQLPESCSDGYYFYVHAGIDPNRDMFDQQRSDLLWIREEFLRSKKKFPKMVIHGHTPQEKIDIRENRINIDSAAVFGYHLTALLIDPTKPMPLGYWTVNKDKKNFHAI